MSYNIQYGMNANGVFKLNNSASAIGNQNLDVVGVQEVDRYTERVPLDEPKIISEISGLHRYVYAKMRNFQGGEYGIAIFTRHEILESIIFHYHPPNIDIRECGDSKPNDYCQGAVAVRIEPESGKQVWFVTTHLGLGMQYEETIQLYEEFLIHLPGHWPVIITGDFNVIPSSEEVQYLRSNEVYDAWTECGEGGNGYTYSTIAPQSRIDYHFLYTRVKEHNVQCVNSFVGQSTSSDHFPLILVAEI